MTAALSTSLLKNKNFHYLMAFVIGIALAFGLQPQEGLLTAEGVRAVAVIIPIMYLWITVDTSWTSLVLFALLIVTGVMTPGAVWAGSMGAMGVTMIIVYFLIAVNMAEQGVINVVTKWFLTRRIAKGRPYVLIGMLLAPYLLLGYVMPTIPLTVLYIGLVTKLCEKTGIKKGDKLYTYLFLALFWGNGRFTASTPIGGPIPIMMISLLYAQTGVTVTFLQWMMVGVPFAFIGFIFIMLILLVVKPDVSPLRDVDIDEVVKDTPPLTRSGKIVVAVAGGLVAFLIIPELLMHAGIMPNIFRTIVGWGPNVPAIAAIGILCMLRGDNKEPVMDFAKTAKGVPLSVILFVATINLISIPMAAVPPAGVAETGIVPWVGSLIRPMVAGLSPYMVFIVLIFAGIVITNLISTTVTMTLCFTVGVAVMMGTGVNMTVFGVLITLAVNLSFLTPAASFSAPLFYGAGHITMANSFKYNLLYIVFGIITLLLVTPIAFAVLPV